MTLIRILNFPLKFMSGQTLVLLSLLVTTVGVVAFIWLDRHGVIDQIDAWIRKWMGD